MKKISIVFIIMLFVISFNSCNWLKGNKSESKEGFFPGKIKVGHLVALDMAPLFIAKEAGFFKEEGLDVETIFFANPGDNNAALAGGSIQFSTNPFTLPYFGENGGIPLRIISGAGGVGVMQVIIQGSYKVEDIPQLIKWIKSHPGMKLKIGVLKGDTLEMIVYKILKDNGLTYDDVQMVWFNDLLAMVQAFQTKQIDILSHIQPYTTDMVFNYGAKMLTDENVVWGDGTPNCTIAVLESFMQKYPGTCKAYLTALNKGYQMEVTDPEKAATLLEKGHYYKVSKDVLIYAFKRQPNKMILYPNKEGMMIAINDMVRAGYIKQPKIDIVNITFLDQIFKNNAK